jgi:predicted secreted hydrolase
VPGKALEFPRDFGSHPDYRIEWWYVTGWLERENKDPIGFQITFFRAATRIDADNPSRFAPKQLIIAHAALSDPEEGKLLHDQKIRREGFDLVYARTGNTDIKLDDWTFLRETDGGYQAHLKAGDFTLQLSLASTQPLMLHGENGFTRKAPQPGAASYYYSKPHLQVSGTISRRGETEVVTGTAWLDHEWLNELIGPDAVGWDWVGANLDDGSAFMAYFIRGKHGETIWAYAALRDASGYMTLYTPDQVSFHPERTWRSPRTQAIYPVEARIKSGEIEWRLTPLMDDQELDSRDSIGDVYWEGAVTIMRDGKPAGRGYLELTGYLQALTF